MNDTKSKTWLSWITKKLPTGELVIVPYGTSINQTKEEAENRLKKSIKNNKYDFDYRIQEYAV